jgi:pyruvate formate lyase activating enzyme
MIECDLCFHRCKLEEGQTGFCRGRKNVDGKVIPLNYGRVTSIALDPIEKNHYRIFILEA